MKSNIIIFSGIILILLSVSILAFRSGKSSIKTYKIKSDIKTSEKQVKTFKKEYDSLQNAFLDLEKQKQEVKTVYLKGKETIKYITKERIECYTDTICKEDILTLKLQLSNFDSLIDVQNRQITNKSSQLLMTEKIILEKDKQIALYKKQQLKTKPLGIGIICGYGTDFKTGLTPFFGIGMSFNLIRL